jgi:hypothetical protein
MAKPLEERQAKRARSNAVKRARMERDPAYRQKINIEQNAKRYGLSVAEYEAMLKRPCAICGVTMREGRNRFSIDHDHDTGKVRDVLCSPCNLALGQFRDDPEVLERAVAYLRRHKGPV